MNIPTARLLVVLGYMAALRQTGQKERMPDYAMVDKLIAELGKELKR